MTPVTVRAAAKINLHLGVGPVREDGYHPLMTLYQAVGVYDDVTVADSRTWQVTVEPVGAVDVSAVPLDDGNIALRAGRLFAAHHGVDGAASLFVAKGIPVAGGSRRVQATSPESTLGAGQKTLRPTAPALLTSAYQAAFTDGTP